MEDVCRHTYLFKRSGSSNYYFRCKIPLDLLKHYAPKKEIRRSLKTSDPKEAMSRVKVEALKQDQEFAEVRRRLTAQPTLDLTDAEIERMSASWFHTLLEEDENGLREGLGDDEVLASVKQQPESTDIVCNWPDVDGRRHGGGLTDREYAKKAESLAIAGAGLKEALARGRTSLVEDDIEEVLYREGVVLDKGSDAYRRLAYAILKTCVRAHEMMVKRHAGEVVDTPPPPPSPSPRPVVAPVKEGVLTLSMVFEKWKAERQPSEKTATDFGANIRRFTELHGDLPLTDITKAHVREFKDAMLRMPARPPKSRQGLTVQQLIKMTEADPTIPRLASKTVNEKALGALNAVLNWAMRNGYRDDNPASGIRAVTGKTSVTRRLPYSIEDLNHIFRFPIFTEGERPLAGGGEAAVWLPLLALFTGARLEELGQLRVDDVKEELGVRYLDMTTIEEGKSFKNESSRRKVPIHSELVRLGFMDYVDRCRRVGEAQLFPKLKAEGDKLTAAWSKWWGRYARNHGLTDGRKVFHSFRHAVKDGFRNNGVAEALADAIQGHAPRHVGGMYGSGYSLPVLAEALEKLRFPGLDLEHLKP